jgi:hypothetical protein
VRLYCMCPEYESRELNRVLDVENGTPTKVQILRRMEVVKTGAEQFLPDGRRHYPNIDVFECQACRRVVIRE